MGIVVVNRIISCPKREESRWFATAIRQQSRRRHGELPRHHRGLRAGHDFTGVARELERALLSPRVGTVHPEEKGYRTIKSPWRLRGAFSPKGEPNGGNPLREETRSKKEADEVSRNERQSEVTREGHGAVLAAHSTEGSYEPGRWGTEAQGTHRREGKAGHNVNLEGKAGDT